MKKLLLITSLVLIIIGCTPKINDLATNIPISATIDLVNITNDMVKGSFYSLKQRNFQHIGHNYHCYMFREQFLEYKN